jgi:hypothetical protein
MELLIEAQAGISDDIRGRDENIDIFGPIVNLRRGASPADRLAAFPGLAI